MNIIIKLQPCIILFFAFLGLLLGVYTPLKDVSIHFVELFLIALLYIIFLSIDIRKVQRAFSNIKYTASSICINFLISPFIAYILGLIFFPNTIALRIGLLMLLVTPCTDWYLVFTRLTKGNVELNLSLLPINLFLQILLLPIYLLVFFDSSINIDTHSLLKSIFFVLCIPFICAMLTRKCISAKNKIKVFIESQSELLQLVFLCLAILIMFLCEGESLLYNYMILLKFFIPLLIFYAFTFFAGSFIASLLKFNNADTISLHFTTLARNSPLALALAVSSFTNEPLIALSLIIGALIELPILSLISSILRRKYER